MQVLFLLFFIFFYFSHILIWGLNLWAILSIMLQPISKKSFILSAQRLSPAFKAQLCILSWSLPFSEHWIISCIFYPGSLQSLHFSARLMNPCGNIWNFYIFLFYKRMTNFYLIPYFSIYFSFCIYNIFYFIIF